MLSAFISSLRTADLRRKILFTLGVVLLYRVGASLPSPGVNYPNVQECIAQVSGGESGQIYSLINLFSGGALLQLSVFAVGVMPYITASIIVQLLTVVIPRFEQLRKEGQSGQVKMTQYTRYLTIALAILQATSVVALAANGGLLQAHVLNLAPGSRSDGLIRHVGEELSFVISGEVDIEVDGKIYLLRAGDSAFFPSSLAHGYYNKGKQITRILWVNTPPSF